MTKAVQWVIGIASALTICAVSSIVAAMISTQVTSAVISQRLDHVEIDLREMRIKQDTLDVRLALIQTDLMTRVSDVQRDVSRILGMLERDGPRTGAPIKSLMLVELPEQQE